MKRTLIMAAMVISSLTLVILVHLFPYQLKNGVTDPTQTAPGFYYTVKRGDSLYLISRRFGTTPERLRQANELQNNNLLLGQRLFIPNTNAQTEGENRPASRNSIDIEMLARLIRAEAEAEPYTGQVAVGAVILNRIDSPEFPNTLTGVIYQPHAFESVTNATFYQATTESARKAAQSAISGWDPSGGAIFFFNPAKTSNAFIWSRKIIYRIGEHVFAI